jgi:hypothetical protein
VSHETLSRQFTTVLESPASTGSALFSSRQKIKNLCLHPEPELSSSHNGSSSACTIRVPRHKISDLAGTTYTLTEPSLVLPSFSCDKRINVRDSKRVYIPSACGCGTHHALFVRTFSLVSSAGRGRCARREATDGTSAPSFT